MELTQSVGWVTFAKCPSFSICFSLIVIFGRSAAGCLLGPCTTGVTVGSILIEYVPGIDPVAFSKSGCWIRSSLRLWSILCILFTRFKALHTFPDKIGLFALAMMKNFTLISFSLCFTFNVVHPLGTIWCWLYDTSLLCVFLIRALGATVCNCFAVMTLACAHSTKVSHLSTLAAGLVLGWTFLLWFVTIVTTSVTLWWRL